MLQLLVQMPQLQVLLPLLQGCFLALQAFEQFVEVDRFLVIVRDPGPQRLDHILLVGSPGEHDRFERSMLARHPLQRMHQLDAIEVRHVQVTEHQADVGVLAEALDGLLAGPTGNADVTAAFQEFAEFFNNQRFVVDHQYFYRRCGLVHSPLHVQAKR